MAVTYEPIATTTLASAASSINFTSIPNTYTDLKVILVSTTSVATTLRFRVNSDSATNYSYTSINGNGTAAASAAATNAANIYMDYNATTSTTIPEFVSIDLFSYAGSTFKTFLFSSSTDQNGSGVVGNVVGMWRSTTAISSINLLTNAGTFNSGSIATLYGIKAA